VSERANDTSEGCLAEAPPPIERGAKADLLSPD
jgi:hypothetical protein